MKKIFGIIAVFVFAAGILTTVSIASGDYWKCKKGNTYCYCDEGEGNCKKNYQNCAKVSNANPGNNQLCKNTK
jgi:hypothetical protein